MSLWAQPSGDEIVLRSIDWLENFPWRNESTVKTWKDKYEICLHVKDFGPEHIKIKVIDGFIVVEGKHEEIKDEYGFVSRSFIRRFPIMDDFRADAVSSRLSEEGILTITVPRKPVTRKDTIIPVSYESPIVSSKL